MYGSQMGLLLMLLKIGNNLVEAKFDAQEEIVHPFAYHKHNHVDVTALYPVRYLVPYRNA